MTHWRGQKTAGASHFPSALRSHNASDLELGARFFSIAAIALPVVIVGFLVISYMALAPLFGLLAVPAF